MPSTTILNNYSIPSSSNLPHHPCLTLLFKKKHKLAYQREMGKKAETTTLLSPQINSCFEEVTPTLFFTCSPQEPPLGQGNPSHRINLSFVMRIFLFILINLENIRGVNKSTHT